MSCGGRCKAVICQLLQTDEALGCASSIKKTLNGIPGVKQVDTSVEQQSVTVVTDDNVAFDAISQAIQSTGKELKGGEVIATGEANNGD